VHDREQLFQLWARVERELRATLELVGAGIGADYIDQIKEFLDHNELGLAFEVLVEGLLESEVAGPQAAYDRLARAKSEMQLADDDAWDLLTARFAKPTEQ